MALNEKNMFDPEMGARIKRLLKEAEDWCNAPDGRGRRSQLARYVGVKPQHVSMWFAEMKKPDPNREPTGEQALALEAFLKYQQGKTDLPT
jgi:hypothetical protein